MEWLVGFLQSVPGLDGDPAVAYLIATVGTILGTMSVVSLVAMVAVYAERKVSAQMQSRIGPLHVGWHGTLQTVADALKLLLKEDIIPAKADRTLFVLAPALVFSGAFLAWAVLPLGPDWVPVNLNIGVVYLLATSSLVAVGIIMAGWASHNKWSLLGAMRTAAQFLSYEIPTALHLLPPVMLAGSLNLVAIVDAQAGGEFGLLNWHIFNPFCALAFACYYISSLAETNRLPFDLPESESELVAGFHSEYSGIRFSFFFLAEYAELFVVSALGAILFLGGWHAFGYESVFIYFAKIAALMYVAMWLRWTLPRFRIDQLMSFCWKFLIPLGLLNLILISIWIYSTVSAGN